MLDHVKNFFINLLTGASAVSALLLVAVGYSDRLDPVSFPLLACIGMFFPVFILSNIFFLIILVIVRWKRIWIPLVGFALAYVPVRTYFPINMGGEPPAGCIKVVSYNVCAFGGNYKYDDAVDTVADYLKRLDADIVCLQEDMGGKGGNGFEKMKELYPYNDTVHVSTSPLVINAVGIHTRYPIIRKERIDYDSSTNGSVAYFLQVGTDTVLVINNHLESTHLSDDMRQRYKEVLKGEMEQEEAEAQMHSIFGKLSESMGKRGPQAEAVSHYVETYSQYPIILCGDFNDTPISYARHTIARNLTDCFVSSGCGLGLSYNQKGFTFRIDNIMCSDHFEPYGCRVDDEMDASDHYPIFCWLKRIENVK